MSRELIIQSKIDKELLKHTPNFRKIGKLRNRLLSLRIVGAGVYKIFWLLPATPEEDYEEARKANE